MVLCMYSQWMDLGTTAMASLSNQPPVIHLGEEFVNQAHDAPGSERITNHNDRARNLTHLEMNSDENTDQLSVLRRVIQRQRYIYRYILDRYRNRSHYGFLLLEISSFIGIVFNILSLALAGYGTIFTVISTIAVAMISIGIKLLNRLYPEIEMSHINTYLKRLKVYMIKLSDHSWKPKPRQMQAIEVLLKSAPLISMREQRLADKSFKDYLKQSTIEPPDESV